MGESGGSYLSVDANTVLADARLQLRWLRDRFPRLPMAVIGHSQGALFTLRLARIQPVDSLVLLGAAIRPGLTTMMSMHEKLATAAQYTGPTREAYLDHIRRLFETIASTDDPSQRRDEVARLVESSVANARDEDFAPDFSSVEEYTRYAIEDAMEWEVRDLLRSDPANELRACSTPALGLWGARDAHVDADAECAAFCSTAQPGSRGEVLDGLNHLFQRSESGSIDTYATDGEAFQNPVADLICGWIKAHAPSGGPQ